MTRPFPLEDALQAHDPSRNLLRRELEAMRISILARHALGTCAAAAMLAGCSSGGSSPLGSSGPSQSAPGGGAPPLAREHVVYTFQGGADGVSPYGALLVQNGDFYGTTAQGGSGPSGVNGTVFEVSASGTKSTLYNFQGGSDASFPEAGLIAGNGGVLYGDTVGGGGGTLCGSGGCGAVYELTPSGSGYTERVIYAFQGGNDGSNPIGNLLMDKSGALYGTTDHGGGSTTACTTGSGVTGCGTVFKLTPSGTGYTETILHSFQAGSDGALPADALIADAGGALYGTTQYGGGTTGCTSASGTTGCGTVFKLTPSGSGYTETVLFSFKGGTNDGSRPRSALLAVKSNGVLPRIMLVGTTVNGGGSGCNGAGCGTVFAVSTSGIERVLHSFSDVSGDGRLPFDENGLHADNNGALYGATELGGGLNAPAEPCSSWRRRAPVTPKRFSTVLKVQGGATALNHVRAWSLMGPVRCMVRIGLEV
jgi:uncharacterized repeat protein (TIGR03803 family)